MSVREVDPSVVKCVTISLAATNALVNRDMHSHVIDYHVKVRQKESFFLFSAADTET